MPVSNEICWASAAPGALELAAGAGAVSAKADKALSPNSTARRSDRLIFMRGIIDLLHQSVKSREDGLCYNFPEIMEAENAIHFDQIFTLNLSPLFKDNTKAASSC